MGSQMVGTGMKGLSRRDVILGAAMTSGARALPAAPGAVLGWYRVHTLRPMRSGELFEIIYEAADGSRTVVSCVVVARKLRGENDWLYTFIAGGETTVAGDPAARNENETAGAVPDKSDRAARA